VEAGENNNYKERKLIIPSVGEIKRNVLINILASIIKNYVNK